MRGKFIFVVLGLFVIYSCASGTLEIQNLADSDLDLLIKKGIGDYQKNVIVKKSETIKVTIELSHSHVRAIFQSPIKNTVNIYEKDGPILYTVTITENITSEVEIKSNLMSCPDIRLVGKWVNQTNAQEYFIFNSENNKSQIQHDIVNRYPYEYFQWKISDNKISFRRWEKLEVNNDNEGEWKDYDFIFIGSNKISIWSTHYEKE